MRIQMAALIASATLGCGNSTGSVKLVPNSTSSVSSALTTTVASTTTTTATTAPTVSSVKVLLNELDLGTGTPMTADEVTHGCMNMGGSDGSGASIQIRRGPFVVSLSTSDLVSGTSSGVDLGEVPAATYLASAIKVAPATGIGEFDGSSVVVEGTYQGASFTYRAAVSAESNSSAAVSVAAGGETTLAYAVNPSAWFTSADGQVLDPTSAANHDAIAARIAASLSAAR